MPKPESNKDNTNKDNQPEQKLPEHIKMLSEANVIYKNDNYETRELQFPDPTGRTAFSITITRLFPGRQTRGHSPIDQTGNELYSFLRGEGICLLHNNAYFVRPGMQLLVHIDKWVKLVNTSSTTDLVFQTYVAGHYKRPDVARK